MDTGSALTVLGGAIGGAKVVEKLLGPTADYIGAGVKNWTEKRVNNVSRIFGIAAKKLGSRIEDEGAVPPKVLKGILDEGSYCDDELSAEYFGGVLASSRTGIARDDRGATYIALLARLSTYQIRAHYCLYHLFKREWNGVMLELTSRESQEQGELGIATSVYEYFMDFTKDEDGGTLISHVITGLVKEFLISEPIGIGLGLKNEPVDVINISLPASDPRASYRTTKDFLYVQPTISGIELFLWAYGKSGLHYKEFFNPNHEFQVDKSIRLPSGSYKSYRRK